MSDFLKRKFLLNVIVGMPLAISIVSIPIATISIAHAMDHAHQEGMSLAQGIPLPQPRNPENIPGYGGTDLPQSHMQSHDLDGISAASSHVQDNEAGSFLVESSTTREQFIVDPHTDPLFKEANGIIANPQKTLEEDVREDNGMRSTDSGKLKICEESGEETLEEGEEFRVVTVKEIKHLSQVRVYSHGWTGGLSRNVVTGAKLDGSTQNTFYYAASTVLYNPLPQNLQNRVESVTFAPGYHCPGYISLSPSGILSIVTASGGSFAWIDTTVDIEILCKPGEEDVTETIENNCQYLEEKVEKGLCSYEDILIIEGPQTRVMNAYPVTRDWWRRKKVYRCHYPSKDDCKVLRAKGCYQVNSRCKEKVGDTCVIWEQTYQCPSEKVPGKSYRSSNKENPFCLSGDCSNQSYASNQDFANVMSQMSVLKEAGNDLRNFGVIFKGQDRRCTRHCVGFKDCCGNGRGWGVSARLTSCDKDEVELAELRKKNRCLQVGTYCAEKKFGVCIRKKTTFCCYQTKLAKIVQEQGKRQLGLGLGSPKNPECQGLSLGQLASLDFSQIDFSNIFSEIMSKAKIPNPESLLQGIQKSMQDKGSLLKGKGEGGRGAPQSVLQGAPQSNLVAVGPVPSKSDSGVPQAEGQAHGGGSQGEQLQGGRSHGGF